MLQKIRNNVPTVKLGVVAVSRDCFPRELAEQRLKKLVAAAGKARLDLTPSPVIIQNESEVASALEYFQRQKVNAVVVYLGNFGPEGPTTIFIQKFQRDCGPVMVCAAAEETGNNLIDGRGDAFCGMLNCSYNLKLRNLSAYIPDRPVGLPDELVKKIAQFQRIAAVVLGLRSLKIVTFGPRPQDFYACNAPIKPLYNLGVEVMENSELDLLELFNAQPETRETKAIAADMAKELGKNVYADLLPKLARFEATLLKYIEDHCGDRDYVIMANKCWPAFQTSFHFVPCFVNSRLASRGIPVACEVDIYGALSEYVAQLASAAPVTILDINNTVPDDLIKAKGNPAGYRRDELFMAFHCGNTPSCHLVHPAMKYQLIMHRQLEPDSEPNISRGTIEGRLRPGDVTLFRLQSTADGQLRSYVAEGDVLDLDPCSFGSIGIFGVHQLARFYRHVLIGQGFPHHAAVAFNRCGGILYDAVQLAAGINPSWPLPESILYPDENPFT